MIHHQEAKKDDIPTKTFLVLWNNLKYEQANGQSDKIGTVLAKHDVDTEVLDHIGDLRRLQIHDVPTKAILDLEISKDRLTNSTGLATSSVMIEIRV